MLRRPGLRLAGAEGVLDLVPEGCERHFVGKRRGHHSFQPGTNAVLVELAQRHACVVRLGGSSCLVAVKRLPTSGAGRCVEVVPV